MNIHVLLTILFSNLMIAITIPAESTSTLKPPFLIVVSENAGDISEDVLYQDKNVPILRAFQKTTKKDTLPIDVLHTNRMIEVMNFMKDHIQSTCYLYEEMKRIVNTRQIKDELREMISFLEKPNNSQLKEKILNFYKTQRTVLASGKDPWRFKNNDLVINYLKDPLNYGVLT